MEIFNVLLQIQEKTLRITLGSVTKGLSKTEPFIF